MPLRTARHDVALIAALLTTAENEARTLGDPEPGAEHLLLASLLLDDPSAREASGLTADRVREAIVTVHAESLAAVGVTPPDLDSSLPLAHGIYHSDISTQEVFQQARRLSRRSATGLRSGHVLLAVAEREHGTAARVLRHLGLERASVIEAAHRVLAQ